MTVPVRLEEVVPLTPGIKRFRFRGVARELPPFSAGSSFRIRLPVGSGVSNAYSLTGDPRESGVFSIAVRKEDPKRSKGGSIYLHERAEVGQVFEASFPENHFPPVRTARHHVLLAAGIGITPFLSYLPELLRWGASYELHFGYRGVEGAPLRELIGSDSRVFFYDSSVSGRLSPAAILDRQVAGAHVYVCGPHELIKAVRSHAAESGWPVGNVHFEQFSPAETLPGRAFSVRLARSSRMVSVASDETLLEALEKQGVDVPFSCRVGGCGTCKVGVIRGGIDHRDDCLTGQEREDGRSIISCISRAANGELILDL